MFGGVKITAGRIIFVALLLVAMAAGAGVYADVSALAEEFAGFDYTRFASNISNVVRQNIVNKRFLPSYLSSL